MSRGDRFRLRTQLVEALKTNDWSYEKINLLFRDFEVELLDEHYDGPSIADVVATMSDSSLVEAYSIVLEMEPTEVLDVVESNVTTSNWKPGYVRLFLSHSASHKKFVGDVANELAVMGIHGFVAHDAMTVSKPWQTQIEQALRSMQVFVALVHPEFNDSSWCQQEVGWAYGRRVPRFAIRIGKNPVGFIGSDQWPSTDGNDPKKVASLVSSWIAGLDELGDSVVEGMFNALRDVGDYYSAQAAAKRLVTLDGLTDLQFQELDRIWWSNDQLYGGVLPTRVMKPYYLLNGRSWPPQKTEEELRA